jgi:hypothetical protein
MTDKKIDFKNYSTKNIVITLLLIVFTVLAVYNYLTAPPPRFCEEKNRGLSNEEFIIAALEDKYKNNEIKIDDSTKTPQDFYKKYPFCCRVYSGDTSKRRLFTGEIYSVDQGYNYVELYFPSSDEVMKTPFSLMGVETYIDKDLKYTRSRLSVGYCGDVGSGTFVHLNIKKTPFGNSFMKSFNLLHPK